VQALLKGVVKAEERKEKDEDRKAAAESRAVEVHDRGRHVFNLSILVAIIGVLFVLVLWASGKLPPTQAATYAIGLLSLPTAGGVASMLKGKKEEG
jgi:hypothetical protein